MRQPVLWSLVLALPLFAGCRVSFDKLPADAPLIDAAPDAAVPVLSCGAPAQFSIAGTVAAFAATATATGYYAFTVDGAGDGHGFSYAFDGDKLAPQKIDVPAFSGATFTNGAAAAIAVGDAVMVTVLYGQPNALGIELVPLDGALQSLGDPQMQAGWFGLDSTIARSPDGTLALLARQSSNDVTAKLVSPTGSDAGTSHLVVDRGESANTATITASDTGFLVTWGGPSTPSANVHAEILDKQLGVMVPDTTINAMAAFAGNTPRAAYAAADDRYLFAWWFKNAINKDELQVSLRDGRLAEIAAPSLTQHGKSPRVVGGKHDFLVVWQDDGVASGLAAARVDFNGNITPLTVDGNGGKALGWDVVMRAGQPALVWLESGVAPTLWLNPLCN